MKEELRAKLVLNWRYFSLEQVDNDEGPEWKIWEQSLDYPVRGLLAFCAAEAARRQSEDAFTSFHIALFRAIHKQRMDIANMKVLIKVAKSVKLDVDQFKKDVNNPQVLDALARDHTFAVETLRVFGTPTLVFPENRAVFIKMSPVPSPDESLPVFNEIRAITEGRPNIKEIKRP